MRKTKDFVICVGLLGAVLTMMVAYVLFVRPFYRRRVYYRLVETGWDDQSARDLARSL